MSEWKVSRRRACRVLQLDPTSYRYTSRRPAQATLESKIKEICQTRVRYGYRRVHVLLKREGWMINHKKTRRIYRELGLQLRSKTPKRRVKAKLRDDRKEATRAHERGGSVGQNRFRGWDKWISASVMLQPGLAAAG